MKSLRVSKISHAGDVLVPLTRICIDPPVIKLLALLIHWEIKVYRLYLFN